MNRANYLFVGLALIGCGKTVNLGVRDDPTTDPNTVWLTKLDDAGQAEAHGIAVAPDEQWIGVVGSTTGTDPLDRPNRDIYVSALDATGRQLWSDTFDLAGAEDTGLSVVVSEQYELYASGSVVDAKGVRHAWVRKWLPNGDVGWTSVAESADAEAAESIALADGHLIAVGYTESFDTGLDIWARAFDAATGAVLWTASYDGPLSGDDEARRAAIWKSGGAIWVAGYQQTTLAAGTQLILLELNPDGAQTWTRSVADSADSPLLGDLAGLALDDLTGDYYVCANQLSPNNRVGDVALVKSDFRGVRQWQAGVDEPTSGARVRDCAFGAGSVVMTGSNGIAMGSEFWVTKHKPDQTRAWRRTSTRLVEGDGVVVRKDGRSLIVGKDDTSEIVVALFSP